LLLGEQGHNGCEQLPKTATRQRRGCDLNPGPILRLSPARQSLGYRATRWTLEGAENARLEIARLEKARPNCRTGNRETGKRDIKLQDWKPQGWKRRERIDYGKTIKPKQPTLKFQMLIEEG